jgi:hypothetical protein
MDLPIGSLGNSFLPQGDLNPQGQPKASADRMQDAIKILSLNLPGQNTGGIAPNALLQSPGGMGQGGFGGTSSVIASILRSLGIDPAHHFNGMGLPLGGGPSAGPMGAAPGAGLGSPTPGAAPGSGAPSDPNAFEPNQLRDFLAQAAQHFSGPGSVPNITPGIQYGGGPPPSQAAPDAGSPDQGGNPLADLLRHFSGVGLPQTGGVTGYSPQGGGDGGVQMPLGSGFGGARF